MNESRDEDQPAWTEMPAPPTLQEIAAHLSDEASAAHAKIDQVFDQIDHQQLAEAQRAASALGLTMEMSVAKLLEPVRRHSFRLRMDAHEQLSALMEESMATSMATFEAADAVHH